MKNNANGDGLGFNVLSIPRGQGRCSVARFTCTSCEAMDDVTIRSGESLNPEAVANTMRSRGWEADPWRANRTRCPRCSKARTRPTNDTDSELRRAAAKLAAAPPPTPPTEPPSMPSKSTPTTAPTEATVTPIREPTSDQRAKIRDLLAAHFDDTVGMYLGGYDDKKVAEEVGNVPWAVVARIREAAFGPIRVTPEMVELREQITAARTRIVNLESSIASLVEQLVKDLAEEKLRIEQLYARVANISKAA